MCGGGGGGGDNGAAEARQREQQRQARLSQGMSSINQAFSGFTDDFYNQRQQAYTDYAMPQLNRQYGDALDDLTFALARSGLLESSVAARKQGDLNEQFQLQRQGVVDEGARLANQARQDIASARSSVINDLYATENPAAAAAAAQARARIATQQPTFSPLGMLFQNVTSGLADWSENRAYSEGYKRGSQPAGATSPSGSGRVVGGP